jgi:hypothetical protein
MKLLNSLLAMIVAARPIDWVGIIALSAIGLAGYAMRLLETSVTVLSRPRRSRLRARPRARAKCARRLDRQ